MADKHWAEAYVGLSYKQYDCAELCRKVNLEQFSRDVGLPYEREPGGVRAVSRMIDRSQDDLAVRIDNPEEGDAVLMVGRGRINHIGVYCLIHGVPHVLHAMRNVGMTCLHRLHTIDRIGLTVEGFYRWK